MTRIAYEGFEANPGFDLPVTAVAIAWFATPTVSGGSTFDPDANPADVGSPQGWGVQCLKMNHVASTDCFDRLFTDLGAGGIPAAVDNRRVISFEFVITAAAFVNGQFGSIVQGLGASFALWRLTTAQTSGVQQLLAQVTHDGTNYVTAWDVPLELNRLYRFQVVWDTGTNVCAFYVSRRRVAVVPLTGVTADDPLVRYNFGTTSGSSNAFTAYVDRIEIDQNVLIDDPSSTSIPRTQRAG